MRKNVNKFVNLIYRGHPTLPLRGSIFRPDGRARGLTNERNKLRVGKKERGTKTDRPNGGKRDPPKKILLYRKPFEQEFIR